MNTFEKHEYFEHHGRNAEGYADPTYYHAVNNTEHNASRRYKLMGIIFAACKALGFEVAERVVLRDTYTGKIYK